MRRKELDACPPDQLLGMLLDEQEAVVKAQQGGHAPTLRFARENLQIMAQNDNPLPENVDDRWVWYFYKGALKKEIDRLSRGAPDEATAAAGATASAALDL